MAKKLTPTMKATLDSLDVAVWRSPYDLQVSIGTLDALVVRKLAEVKAGLGSIASPRTSVKYRLTAAGVAARDVS